MIHHHVFLRGGIGNQFFQWVYAKHLQQRGLIVKLNVTFLNPRQESQESKETALQTLLVSLDMPICSWKYLSSLEFAFKRLGLFFGVLEDDHHAKCNPESTYFHYGYYQTSKYIDHSIVLRARELLKEDLRTCDLGSNFCVLHVRAGDYLTKKYNFNQLGVLSTEYHVSAGKLLLEKYPRNKLIIVTDDENYSLTILDKLKHDYSDRVSLLSMELQRREKQIDAIKTMLSAEAISISNSSFGAMCAILGKARDVLYPKPWFRSRDLWYVSPVLDHWTMLESSFEV